MKQKTYSFIIKVIKSELISGSFFLFAGTTIANILAFIFNLFLVRHLSYGQYAEFSALISLITLASIPAQSFLPTIVHFSGKYFANNDKKNASLFFRESSKKIGILAIAFFIAFFFLAIPIGRFLHIKDYSEIILIGGVVSVIYLGITNNAFLQGLLRFPFLSGTIVLGGLLKLFMGAGLYLVGLGLNGIFLGYLLSFLIPFLVTYIPLKKTISFSQKNNHSIAMNEVITYGLPATLAILSLSSFTSTDILLIKHFFTPTNAALYSGLSLIGRIIFYFTAPIPVVMFPLIVKRFHKGENFHKLLYASFLLVLLPSSLITAFYFVFPKLAISIFLGAKYFAIAPYIGWFGLYLCIFSLLNVLINFFLSLKKTYVSWFVAGGALVQGVGIVYFHSNIAEIIVLSLIISLVLFIILLLYYIREYATYKKTN